MSTKGARAAIQRTTRCSRKRRSARSPPRKQSAARNPKCVGKLAGEKSGATDVRGGACPSCSANLNERFMNCSGIPRSRELYHGNATTTAMAPASPIQRSRRQRRAPPPAPAAPHALTQGPEQRRARVDRKRRLGEEPEAPDESEGRRPSRPRESLGADQHVERQGDHRYEGQVELEGQQRIHHQLG